MRWFTTPWWRRKAAPPLPSLPEPAATRSLALNEDPIPLLRVFPPLESADRYLVRESENKFTEQEITSALELLRGGAMRTDGPKRRITRPARFHIAIQHVQGFSTQCLATQHDSKIPIQDMYAGYLLWAAEWRREPINRSDFDFAMSDQLASVGGIRTERYYNGCRFRPDFIRRLEAQGSDEIQKRLGLSKDQLVDSGKAAP